MNGRSFVITLGLMVSLFMLGCGSSGSDTSGDSSILGEIPSPDIAPPSVGGLPTIPVYVFVLTRNDQTGNEYFSQEYAQQMLAQVVLLSSHTVEITLAGFHHIQDDNFDSEFQADILWHYLQWRINGFVTVFISQPYTVDATGSTFQAGQNQNTAPFFVMRTRNLWRERHGDQHTFGVHAPVGSEDDIDEAARVWLHELGHNMALMHSDVHNPFLPVLTKDLNKQFIEAADFHTDNYYAVDPQFLVHFAKKLEESKGTEMTSSPNQDELAKTITLH